MKTYPAILLIPKKELQELFRCKQTRQVSVDDKNDFYVVCGTFHRSDQDFERPTNAGLTGESSDTTGNKVLDLGKENRVISLMLLPHTSQKLYR
jgi:hypothetical protein